MPPDNTIPFPGPRTPPRHRRVAILVPGLDPGGDAALAPVARFLKGVLDASERYRAEILSVSASGRDPSSPWYRPSPEVVEILEDYDLVHVVADSPGWALVGKDLRAPVTLHLTGAGVDGERDDAPSGPARLWRRLKNLASTSDAEALTVAETVFVDSPRVRDELAARIGLRAGRRKSDGADATNPVFEPDPFFDAVDPFPGAESTRPARPARPARQRSGPATGSGSDAGVRPRAGSAASGPRGSGDRARDSRTASRRPPARRRRLLVVSPPGVDTELFHPRERDPEWVESRLREMLGCPDRRRGYLLAVGPFADPRRDVATLFRAYARLRRADRNAPRLVLCGPSEPCREDWDLALDLRVRAWIEYRPEALDARLPELYRDASVLVVSSTSQGLEPALLQAMAAGLPIVTTDCGGPADLVEDGVSGYVVPVGDADLLASRVRRLLSSAELRQDMSRAARNRAEQDFDREVAGRRFLEAFDRILGIAEEAERAAGAE